MQTTGRENDDQIYDIPVLTDKRLVIYVGAYGSGKSEVAVNSALYIAGHPSRRGRKVVLADLDMINPFYRSADARTVLENNGILLIASGFVNSNVEAPSVPAEISSVFDSENMLAVLDIGGEDMGARVVASMKDRILETDHEILMVINTKRPFTSDAEQISRMKSELENACGINITGLVNNTNLLSLTTPDELHASACVIREV